MECVKIALCDDEEGVFYEVRSILEEFSKMNHVDMQVDWFPNGRHLIGQLEQYALVLLDIEMPEMDGISFGREAKRRGYQGKIIMLTGNPGRFQEVFEFQAFRFVTKPIGKEELSRAVQAYLNTRIGAQKISVYRNKREILLKEREICYIRSEKGDSRIFTRTEEFRSDKSLDTWKKILDERLFVRSNRQILVNVAYILMMESELELITGEKLPYSRRRKRHVQETMDAYDLYYR